MRHKEPAEEKAAAEVSYLRHSPLPSHPVRHSQGKLVQPSHVLLKICILLLGDLLPLVNPHINGEHRKERNL